MALAIDNANRLANLNSPCKSHTETYGEMKMHRATVAVIFSASLFSGTASAQDLSGWCLPADECMGVQMPIGSGTYDTCEERCTLTNPVPVRDMDATLYDEVCRGDWMENGSMTNRIMLIKQASNQTRMFAIREGWITQLERCK